MSNGTHRAKGVVKGRCGPWELTQIGLTWCIRRPTGEVLPPYDVKHTGSKSYIFGKWKEMHNQTTEV